MSEVLRFMVELNQRYIDQPQVLRLKNTMLEISPDDLKGEFDIDVNTEAGVGKKKQTIQNLQIYLANMAQVGMQIGAITPGEWAKAAQKLLQESGIRDPSTYVRDPEEVKQEFYMMMMQNMQAQQEQAQEQAQQEQMKAMEDAAKVQKLAGQAGMATGQTLSPLQQARMQAAQHGGLPMM